MWGVGVRGDSASHEIPLMEIIIIKILCKCCVLRLALFVRPSETHTCKFVEHCCIEPFGGTGH